MKHLSLLLVVAALAVPAAAPADGCPATTCGKTGSTVPGSRLLVVRTAGDRGPLLAYDIVTRRKRFALPNGLLTADGRRFFSSRAPRRGTTTTIERYSARTGQRQARITLGRRYDLVAVSARGDRLVLAGLNGARRTGNWLLTDAGGRILRRLTLRGAYDAEAISPDGRRLFLVHWLRNGYELQVYDFATRRLSATPVANEPDEKMTGVAWTAVASRDGRWLLTLYLEANGGGFIHALDLRAGVGYCLDLHYGYFNTLAASALALSPDERKLYVVSPIVGRVATLDLRSPRVTRVARFPPVAPRAIVMGIGPSAAASPDGRTVFFTAGSGVLAYDGSRATVRGPYRVGRAAIRRIPDLASALGVTPDGRRVVVLRVDGALVALDARSGRRLA